MIIDIHTHCFPDELAPRAISSLARRAEIKPYLDGTVADLRRSMGASKVDLCILQPIATKPQQTPGINRWAAGVQDRQILSFGTIHPEFPGWKDEIKWLREHGIKGVKFHPDYQDYFVDDERVYPIYEGLFNEEMIILFHGGVDLGFPPPYRCTPQRLARVLNVLPGGTIIAAHMGGYRYWEDTRHYLAGKNIYFDTSYSSKEMGTAYMGKVIREHGADKILFGTDSPWGDQIEEISNIRSLDLREDEMAGILWKNAARLLCLEMEPSL